MQHMSIVDQLQLIDQQVLRCELSQGEQAAVDEYRVWSSQKSSHYASELGPYPEDLGEQTAWQSRKLLRDKELDIELAHERHLRGKQAHSRSLLFRAAVVRTTYTRRT